MDEERMHVLQSIRTALETDVEPRSRLESVCTLLVDEFPAVHWAGFYGWDPELPDELVLGPYAGETVEQIRVRMGTGAVGRAALERDLFTGVDPDNPHEDVELTLPQGDHEDVPGAVIRHPDMRSEMAVPVERDGELLGVLVVDSRLPAVFRDDDRTFLKNVSRLISEHIAALS
ncbi:MAG: GAF domain-containing protein [Candidatus Krumholzibacteriia bacterium]